MSDALPSADPLNQALTELAKLVGAPVNAQQISELRPEYIYYLLLLWASIHVYQIEPYPESKDDEGGEKGGGSMRVFPLENGRKIIDFGDCLSVSAGENYGSYCTGWMIEAAKKMIKILHEKGVTKIGVLGHDIAKRVVWMESLRKGIEVINFTPTRDDFDKHYRLYLSREMDLTQETLSSSLASVTDRRPE